MGDARSDAVGNRIVNLFNKDGIFLSKEALDVILQQENPIDVAKNTLNRLKQLASKPLVVTPNDVRHNVRANNEHDVTQVTLTGEKFEDWDFVTADTQYLTHGLHPYPARMIPQIARRLILRYSGVGDVVLDPFCGSGGVLTEARLLGRNAIGSDINHLAVMLARAKSTPIDSEVLKKFTHNFLHNLEKAKLEYKETESAIHPPSFPNLKHWFKDYVIKDLANILNLIKGVEDERLQNLMAICFSKTMFKASNIDLKSSYYIRILPKDKLRRHKPNVFALFGDHVKDALKRVGKFSRECKKWEGKVKVGLEVKIGDARHLTLEDNCVDLIVTSPPYGEEKNTIDYNRWSKLALYWFGYKPATILSVKKVALGGKRALEISKTPSETLNKVLREVAKQRKIRRVKDALPFFFDYHRSLQEMYRVLKREGRCCIVIGNRSISRQRLDMGKVTVELAQDVDFMHEKTHLRRFPYKAIPFVSGDTETMTQENIVILSK